MAKGAIHIETKVKEISPDQGSGCSLKTDQGNYAATHIVLAAGVWSYQLLEPFGIKLPLEAERGYHLIFRNPGIAINNSVMDLYVVEQDVMALTPTNANTNTT